MWSLIHSEFVAWAKAYDGPRFHAVLCDPPYGLEFMGKDWDAPWKKGRAKDYKTLTGIGPAKFKDFKALPQLRWGGNKRCLKCKKWAWDYPERKCVCANPEFPVDTSFLASYQAWTTEWAQALLPLLHPGALVFAFGGTRTWHRLACGFEDAGFEIWDTLMWLHGQGFPKAQDISKLIDRQMGATDKRRVVGRKSDPRYKYEFPESSRPYQGKTDHNWTDKTTADSMANITAPGSTEACPWSGHKTAALKPAWEPILCFRAPRQGKNYAELALKYGSGALNVDGGRIQTVGKKEIEWTPQRQHSRNSLQIGGLKPGQTQAMFNQAGRYPANLALDEESAEMLDEQAGERFGRSVYPDNRQAAIEASGKECDTSRSVTYASLGEKSGLSFSDRGGPSRFYYCAKSSRSEREAGLEGLEKKFLATMGDGVVQRHHNESEPKAHVRNPHPTIKPLSLTRWLATLLLPPNSVKPRRLLVPFAGVASEMIGAIQAGWDEIVGIEQSEEYVRIGEARLRYWEVEKEPSLF